MHTSAGPSTDTKEVAQQLFAALLNAQSVLLTGPTAPDGDSLGACLSLQMLLLRHGKHAEVAGVPSYRYAWMPGIDHLIDDAEVASTQWDAVVVLDGDRHRLTPAVDAAFSTARVRGIIDHHASTTNDGYTHFWVAPNVGSTCEMIYEGMRSWGDLLNAPIARCLYTGLIFDTGGFRYSNTRPSSHEMAAELLRLGIDPHRICLDVLMDRHPSGLKIAGDVYGRAEFLFDGAVCFGLVSLEHQRAYGVVEGDLEGIVESLVQVKGVEVGVLAIEHPGGQVKLSLRSRDTVDVAAIARAIHPSGGGHTKAAGVQLEATADAVKARVMQALNPTFPNHEPTGETPT